MSDVGTGSSTEPSQGGSSASANTVYAKALPGTKRIARVRKRHLGMLQTMLEASRRAAEFVTSVRYSFCSIQHELVALSKTRFTSCPLPVALSKHFLRRQQNKYQLLGHTHAVKCNAASQDPLQRFCDPELQSPFVSWNPSSPACTDSTHQLLPPMLMPLSAMQQIKVHHCASWAGAVHRGGPAV